jgi:hypothetical protein
MRNNGPYWDLVIANTIEVTIKAQLDPSKAGRPVDAP